ncbi:hypothetical protein [Streptomyces violascens]|uniref:hypothetical protein n=1 Tax=Streptomyces violascens TaxID=67381 RepID=UPI003682A43C
MKWPWRKPPTPRADLLQIAILEYQLFGIKPGPAMAGEYFARYRYFLGASDHTTEADRRNLAPAEAQAAWEARQ